MSELVRVRNKNTGAVASLPEASLPMFFNWEIDPGPAPEKAKPKRNLKPLDTDPEDDTDESESPDDEPDPDQDEAPPAVPAAATRRSNS